MVGKARRRGGGAAGRAEASVAVAWPAPWRLPGPRPLWRAAADSGLRDCPRPVRPAGWALPSVRRLLPRAAVRSRPG